MTRPALAPERADKWISRAAAATVAGLTGIAGAISYSHMRQLAATHGDVGWHAHAFPLSVDGVEIVVSLVLLADRRAGRKSGWLPWAALTHRHHRLPHRQHRHRQRGHCQPSDRRLAGHRAAHSGQAAVRHPGTPQRHSPRVL